MTDDPVPTPLRREIAFARLDFKQVAYANNSQRRYLLMAKYYEPAIVGLDRLEVFLNVSKKDERLDAYLLRRNDGDRKLSIIDGRLEAILASAEERPGSITLRVDAMLRLPRSSTRVATPTDIPDCARLRDAETIELRGPHEAVEGSTRAGYEALFVERVRSVGELQAALPEELDALAVAMRLAWLGEIAFIGTGISDRSRFAHNPVDATTTGPFASLRTRRGRSTVSRRRSPRTARDIGIAGRDSAADPTGTLA